MRMSRVGLVGAATLLTLTLFGASGCARTSYETEYRNTQTRLEQKSADYDSLQSRYDKKLAELGVVQGDFDKKVRAYGILEGEKNDLQRRFDSLSGEKSDLQKLYGQSKQDLKNARTGNGLLRDQNRSLLTDKSNLTTQYSGLQDQYKAAIQENSNLTAQLQQRGVFYPFNTYPSYSPPPGYMWIPAPPGQSGYYMVPIPRPGLPASIPLYPWPPYYP